MPRQGGNQGFDGRHFCGLAYIGLGWMFRGQIEILGVLLERVGVRTGIVVLAGLAVYVAVKYWQRQRIYRALRIARITPREWPKADACMMPRMRTCFRITAGGSLI